MAIDDNPNIYIFGLSSMQYPPMHIYVILKIICKISKAYFSSFLIQINFPISQSEDIERRRRAWLVLYKRVASYPSKHTIDRLQHGDDRHH